MNRVDIRRGRWVLSKEWGGVDEANRSEKKVLWQNEQRRIVGKCWKSMNDIETETGLRYVILVV